MSNNLIGFHYLAKEQFCIRQNASERAYRFVVIAANAWEANTILECCLFYLIMFIMYSSKFT